MQRFMRTSSKHFETTFSPEIENQIKDVLVRASRFKNEADKILNLTVSEQAEVPDKIVQSLFERFHLVALELKDRYDQRGSLEIKDEYDVQDLLRALLKTRFDDVRMEEWCPSYAGASPRMDTLLKNEKISIETKMTRQGLGQKQVREQIIIDKSYYKGHPDCKKLYCLVYDPAEKIKNITGFEKDLSDIINGFETKVFVIPKRV